MTGTALTEEKEFRDIYGMDVIEIPTINRSSVSIIMMPYIRPRKKNIVQLSRK